MAKQSSTDSNLDAAQRRQESFDAYLVGLVFTLLGLSVQTAEFGLSIIGDILELSSWLMLLVSGLAGLSRMEWIPEVLRLASHRVEREVRVRDVKVARLQGSQTVQVIGSGEKVAADAYIAQNESDLVQINEAETKAVKVVGRRYFVFKWGFASAACILVIARAWVPACTIIQRLRA